jgi:hypothetical protein
MPKVANLLQIPQPVPLPPLSVPVKFAFRSALSTEDAINVQGGVSAPGTPLILYPVPSGGATPDELWELQPDPAGSGYYYIVSSFSALVIDVRGASTQPGTAIQAFTRNPGSSDNQLWTFVPGPAGQGYNSIQSKLSSPGNALVINVQGGSTAPGTPLILYPAPTGGATPNELWIPTLEPPSPNGSYFFLRSKLAAANVMDVRGASTQPGTPVQLFTQNPPGYDDDQLWQLVPQPSSPGYYYLQSKLASGNVIGIQGQSPVAGQPLVTGTQLPAGADTSQLWQFVSDPAGSGYWFIQSKLNGTVMDGVIPGTPGTPLQSFPQNPAGQTDPQLWLPVLPLPAPAPVPPDTPSINSVSAAVAAAAQSLTVSGAHFGETQGTGYLAVTDGSSTWGPPGASALQVSSWSETQITFTVPDAQPPVTPGTTATVQVVIPWANGLASSNIATVVITAVPVISNINVSQAAPGNLVTINGQNFCAQQGNGYVQVSDNQASWGNPGAPAVNVMSWSDTQIIVKFPNGPTCGTQAQVSITNAAGLNSNTETLLVTSGAVFPISADSGDTQIGSTGYGHMHTVVTIQANGALTATTTISDTSPWGPLTGFHGATVITIYDATGHQLDQWYNGPFGIEGGQSYPVAWTETLTAEDLACVYSISVVNFYDPQWSAFNSIVSWIEQNGSTLVSLATKVAGAFS